MIKKSKLLPALQVRNIRLRLSISVIFLLLVTPVFIAFILYSYQTNYSIYKKNAVSLVSRANENSIRDLINFIEPISSAVRVTSKLIASNPELINQDKIAEHSMVNLENNPNIVSYFIASEEGSMRQVQRTDKNIPVGGRVPPDGSQYVSWVIDRSKGFNNESTYTFFKSWGDVVEKFTSSKTKYDPRERRFYKGMLKNVAAGKVDSSYIDDPIFTVSTNQAVIATTHPIFVENQLIGAVIAQVQIKAFSDFLKKNKTTKNSQTIIFNSNGYIIVHPDVNMGFVKEKDVLVPRRLVDLEDSPASVAKKIYDQNASNLIDFNFGEDKVPYLAVINSFPAHEGKPWSVMTVVPVSDFMVELNEINRKLILFGIFSFIGIAFLAAYFSTLISKPLEKLTIEIQNILSFKNENLAQVSSSIYEIRTLSKTIKSLKSTIGAFTSYVPRDLVNELLNSGKDIELGGESRYMTILFSDIKGFTSLSEITPSRELLRRVSSYLELMTHAIKEEGGTVDKFIGDSVMAFWGAPLLNQNHAYHACLAAVKAQRRLVSLNQHLISEKKPPLIVRIGIHSDAVLVGNIGSSERLSYTVMGDGVNIASRLEGMNKEFGTGICVSHSLFKEAGERLWVRPIDLIIVKGRNSEILIYELVGVRDGDSETNATQAEQDLCNQTSAAFERYVHGDFQEAMSMYRAIAEQFNDELSKTMVQKCESKLGT